ncbi:uncharacterized protein PV09_06149 [Verruconis gallopava]|uniref:Uncharacterized protein n=1 Tax=Verruconis gallopava TaxID=253628 RepID=A0A0D2A7I2_9PEZI|nr:uncharacterized protein PV09_06149 [Verruconis gallopava]KIW02713.1 hypothetical protein PV09_06149 [Verruconis gallopava]
MPVDAATSAALAKIWDSNFNPTAGIDTPTFPATIAALAALGVNRYRVDFVAQTVTSYVGTEVDTYTFSHATDAGTIKWSETKLKQAIKKAQDKAKSGRSDYAEFEKEAIAAGVSDYTTYLDGKRVVYASVLGDLYTEPFSVVQTGAKPDARRLREAVGMVDI